MKRVFISQPMGDKTDVGVLTIRAQAAAAAQEYLGEEIDVIDSFRPNQGPSALFQLGQAICMMSQADLVYFTEGWENHRGCKIEHMCAVEYGLNILET